MGQGNISLKNDIFAGWNDQQNGSGTHYNGGDTLPALSRDVTLYAQWLKATKTSNQENPNDTLKAGEKITYTIVVTVPETTESLIVTDTIPAEKTYVTGSISANGDDSVLVDNTGELSWTIPSVASDETVSVSFTVKTGTATANDTLIKNKATVTADTIVNVSNETENKLIYTNSGGLGGSTTYTATLVKVDSKDSNTLLSGAKFELYKTNTNSNATVGTYTTNLNGKITVNNLGSGDY